DRRAAVAARANLSEFARLTAAALGSKGFTTRAPQKPALSGQAHRGHLVGSREPLQRYGARRFESDIAGALRQLAQQGRREDLAAGCFPRDARGKDDALAVEVVALAHRLPRVQADANAHWVLRVGRAVPREPLLNADRAQDGAPSTPEC